MVLGSLAGLRDDSGGLTCRVIGGVSSGSMVRAVSLSVSSEIDWKSSSSA